MDGKKELESNTSTDGAVSEIVPSNATKMANFKLFSPKLKVKQSSVTSFFTPVNSAISLDDTNEATLKDHNERKSVDLVEKPVSFKETVSDSVLNSQDIQNLQILSDLQNESVALQNLSPKPKRVQIDKKRRRIHSSDDSLPSEDCTKTQNLVGVSDDTNVSTTVSNPPHVNIETKRQCSADNVKIVIINECSNDKLHCIDDTDHRLETLMTRSKIVQSVSDVKNNHTLEVGSSLTNPGTESDLVTNVNKLSDNMRNISIQVNSETNEKTVSFQVEQKKELEFSLPEEGLVLFRQARGALLTKARHLERLDHLTRLRDKNIIAPWSANLDAWPSQFLTVSDKSRFCDLQRKHAMERVDLFRELVATRLQSDEHRVSAFTKTLATFCIETELEDQFDKVDSFVMKQYNTERAKYREIFEKRENEWKQNDPSFDQLWAGLTAKSKPASSTGYSGVRNRSRSRSRSRSPGRKSERFGSPNPTRGRGGYRGRGNSSRGRPTRGSSYRGRQPDRNHYGRKAHGGGYELTNLTTDEVAVVLALRENKGH